jgi:predicted Holliday junction resolvase-like endonuclease
MIEALLFLSIGVIIYLLFFNRPRRVEPDDREPENEFLRTKLRDREAESIERENNLNKTIKELQSSLSKQQDLSSATNLDLKSRESKLVNKVNELQVSLSDETEARKKVLSQKKSGEVRLGHIAETLAPFLDQFDFEPERCSFMGQPIDYISFGDDEITFIEIKSGNSQLSQKQRHIRDLVKQKLVAWKEVRIK